MVTVSLKNLQKRNSTVSQDITNALLKLMKRQNFNEITIVDIVNEAKVGRVSFYRNFNSKEDVIKKYLDEITNNFMKESQIHNYRDNLKMFLTILFTHLKNNFDFANVLLKANIIHFVEDEFDKMFSRNKGVRRNRLFKAGFLRTPFRMGAFYAERGANQDSIRLRDLWHLFQGGKED